MGATKLNAEVAVPLADLADSWLLGLEAGHKSPATLRAYGAGVAWFLRWHATRYPLAEPVLDKPAVNAYLADLRRAGQAPGTCRLRYSTLRQFAAWLYDEGEADTDTLDKMKPPKLDKPVVPRLSDEELTALLRACRGTGFTDRRDEALIRLMTEGLLRAGEALGLRHEPADVDVRRGLALVRRGKGGKGRTVPFGPETGRAIDRYLRLRRRHPLAHTALLAAARRGPPHVRLPGPRGQHRGAGGGGRD